MNEDGGFQPRSTAPVNVGDELDVTIESVGAKGDGVTKKEGFVIFVPGVQKGDNVRIKVTRVLRKVGFGEVVGSSSASEESEAPSQDEMPNDDAAAQSDESSPQDTEDFGEEEKQR